MSKVWFNKIDILYNENGKKNTYKWMRKDLLNSSTNESDMDYFRYEITKIPVMWTQSWEGKHGTRVRGKKDILTKVTNDSVKVSGPYYPVVSNIGTTSTPANTTVLRYSSLVI